HSPDLRGRRHPGPHRDARLGRTPPTGHGRTGSVERAAPHCQHAGYRASPAMISKSGKIITFYSYKGGTGRSLAVSNVAWILASNGYDVLLIDWDLEAPGLYRYLRPFLVDPELTSSPGVIDFVWDAARVNVTPADKSQATSLSAEFPSLEDYVVGLDWDFHDNGSISLIPAGPPDPNYAQPV